MNRVPRTLSLALGIALALGTAALPAAATAAPVTAPGPAAAHGYTPGVAAKSVGKADDRAFYEAVMKSARAKQAATPYLRAVVVTYDASNAPSFAAEIARSAQIWNGSVANVRLQEGSGADFDYYEGDDPDNGSYASTDGHGRGYIFLDYSQNQQYSSVRVTAHETGHVLGLPDHYSGPCSELMSGGGPGPSCTNAYPNSAERSRVNSLWRNGLAG
ncbi:snapalysin [Kitasatospora purpeofusca]|uniref:snapalysin n=1 Tax=Kitasatospora purpeofusca TaxID=67352 RepID=UPI0022562C67|nr:snapalysin [Kitasatospora purpeofusca]MCX4752863.1 snapalysin [Kitasatospora purpeofusca]WSR32411.1 snapalysin [Kitasatospora purpeofusca]